MWKQAWNKRHLIFYPKKKLIMKIIPSSFPYFLSVLPSLLLIPFNLSFLLLFHPYSSCFPSLPSFICVLFSLPPFLPQNFFFMFVFPSLVSPSCPFFFPSIICFFLPSCYFSSFLLSPLTFFFLPSIWLPVFFIHYFVPSLLISYFCPSFFPLSFPPFFLQVLPQGQNVTAETLATYFDDVLHNHRLVHFSSSVLMHLTRAFPRKQISMRCY